MDQMKVWKVSHFEVLEQFSPEQYRESEIVGNGLFLRGFVQKKSRKKFTFFADMTFPFIIIPLSPFVRTLSTRKLELPKTHTPSKKSLHIKQEKRRGKSYTLLYYHISFLTIEKVLLTYTQKNTLIYQIALPFLRRSCLHFFLRAYSSQERKS